jgi:DNA-binding NarL/FixJ family response regulator
VRLVLCDDNRILCDALAVALEARGHQALAITTNPDDGVAAVAREQPDACLLDLRFPDGQDGLAAARAIRREHPGTAVLVLSALADPAVCCEARKIGVAGFLGKDRSIDRIADALDVVAEGGEVFAQTPPRGHAGRPAGSDRSRPRSPLTGREQEVLSRIAEGQGTGQMAREMEITTGTLRTYVRNALGKLGAHSRVDAAALISREGLRGDGQHP